MTGIIRETVADVMGRKQLKPDYDPEKIQNEMISVCKELCIGSLGEHFQNEKRKSGSLRAASNELGISVSKVMKLLITGGYYSSDIYEQITELTEQGKTVSEIQELLGVSRATVQSYLPYRKGIYSAKDTSVNADRIRMFRERNSRIEALCESMSEDALWDVVVSFQNYPFHTASGLPFSYVLKVGRDGTLNKELVVNRRQESKTLAWSSVRLAFSKAIEMQGQVVDRPKALGDIRGISYIYPMLFRFGIIEVPEKTAEKMQLKLCNSAVKEINVAVAHTGKFLDSRFQSRKLRGELNGFPA